MIPIHTPETQAEKSVRVRVEGGSEGTDRAYVRDEIKRRSKIDEHKEDMLVYED
jgi:hypothetical protein